MCIHISGRVSIEDNGVGIPQEKLDELFTRKSNESTHGTEDEKGTGLGLLVCIELVELNGGKLWAKSIVNKGSTFFFTVPKAKKSSN